MRTRSFALSVVTCLVALGSGGPSVAGTITSIANTFTPGASTGTFGPIGATPAPNNDNATGASPNTVPYSVFFNSPGALEVEFNTASSGGTTEYRFTQTFVNNSGLIWDGFAFELGFGSGAAFVRSLAADFLDFDAPDRDPAPTAGAFSALASSTDLLTWTGGAVPSIGVVAFTFAVDVPDNLAALNPFGLSRFTVRQTPRVATVTVPEPPIVLLLGTMLLAVVVIRRVRAARQS